MRYEPPETIEDIPTVAELVARADVTVAGLPDAKLRIAWALRRHLVSAVTGAKRATPNLLVLGPTGGGKTFLVRTMLEAAGCVYGEVQATEYSDVGYRGRDLVTMYASLIAPRWQGDKGGGEVSWSQREMIRVAQRFGVVMLDEFDKLRMTREIKRGVKKDGAMGEREVGRVLQGELLKLVEGASVHVERFDNDRGFDFDTTNVLHIALGAFDGLAEIQAELDGLEHPTPQDLISLHMDVDVADLYRYGFMPELLGRFSCLIPLPRLDHDAVHRIIREQMIPIYEREFAEHGLGFHVDDGAIAVISGYVLTHGQSGARTIPAILEEMTWKESALAHPGDTIALTADSASARHAEIWPGRLEVSA